MVNDQLWYLANGSQSVRKYSGCVINGVRFRTRELDDRRITQNSGVHVIAPHGTEEQHKFYGHLCNVWELEYMCRHIVVLFECAWYNTGNAIGRKATIKRDLHCTSIDVRRRWYENDPFILPSQAQQVFYVNDTKLGENWKVVLHCQTRGNFDFPEGDDDAEPNSHSEPANGAFQHFVSTVPIQVVDEDNNVPGHRVGFESRVIAGDVIIQAMNDDTIVSDDDDDVDMDGNDLSDEEHDDENVDCDDDMDDDVSSEEHDVEYVDDDM